MAHSASGKKIRFTFPEQPVVSGFVAAGKLAGRRRFSQEIRRITVTGRRCRLRLELREGPVAALTAEFLLGRFEAIGVTRSGEPVLLSGVLVNRRPFLELCLEWQRHLDS